MTLISKIKGYILNNKLLAIMCILFALMVIPMYIMCMYAEPAADDFVQAARMKFLFESKYSFIDYFNYVFRFANELYMYVQGAFTIDTLIYLNPIAYNIDLYPIPCIINLTILILSATFLSHCICKYILKANNKATLFLSITSIFLMTQFVSPSESFYWYAGIVAYTLPFSFSMVFAGMIICIFQKNKKSQKILLAIAACLIGFLLGGTNYPLSLFLCCSVGMIIIIGAVLKKKSTCFVVPIELIMAASFVINIISPGNKLRMDVYEQLSVKYSIVMSFYSALNELIGRLTHTPILFVVIISIPAFIRLIDKLGFKFRLPLLVTIISFCLSATTFTPIYYATTILYMPSRYLNMVYMIYIWILLVNLFYWIAWARKKYFNFKLDLSHFKLLLTAFACVSLMISFSSASASEMTTMVNISDLALCKAQNYNVKANELFYMLEHSEDKTVYVESFGDVPSLHEPVVSADPSHWQNKGLALFFEKDQVRLDN